MNITYKSTVSAEEVNFLRASVEFRQILPEQINAGLDGSALVVSAYDRVELTDAGFKQCVFSGEGRRSE